MMIKKKEAIDKAGLMARKFSLPKEAGWYE